MGIEVIGKMRQPALAYNWDVVIRSPFMRDVDGLKFRAKTSTIPDKVSQPIEIPYKGRSFYFPGRDGSSHTIDLTFWEDEDLTVYRSLYAWTSAVLEQTTGVQSPKESLVGVVQMNLLSSIGGVIGTWKLMNAWPENLQAISLDYSASNEINISVTIRYDYTIF